MVERGSLQCWYEEGIPMSLQAVYAACLEHTGGLEYYQVYAYLRRCGYAVFRPPERQFDNLFKAINYPYKDTHTASTPVRQSWGSSWTLGIFGSLFSRFLLFLNITGRPVFLYFTSYCKALILTLIFLILLQLQASPLNSI